MTKKNPNNGDQLDDNKFVSFKILKKSIFLILKQWQLDDINNFIQIPTIWLIKENRISFLNFAFQLEIKTFFEAD